MLRRPLLSLVLVLALAIPCLAQPAAASKTEGGITGMVLTENSQLAYGAKPCTLQTERNHTQINCLGTTDKEGRFTIEHLKPGKYEVFAINDAEGYSVVNQTPGQEVTITADQLWTNVTIRLRRGGGILVGTITDKLTGRNIPSAQVQYTAIDRNGSGGSHSVSGESFNVPVPADCDVLVVVMADGYKGWVYMDAASQSRPVLRLSSGERKMLNIQLEPLSSNSALRDR